MKIVFGTKTCPECMKLKRELEEKGEQFTYWDIATVDGMAEAAERGLMSRAEKKLPIVIEELSNR